MVRPPSIDSNGMKKGAWSEDEDNKLRAYIQRYGHWNWRLLPKFAGLKRCGKSCRLRWVNYLKPGVERGNFSKEEQELVIKLHLQLGNKWSAIAEKLPGRTDNEIKNFWHTRVERRRRKQPPLHHHNQIKNPIILPKADDNLFEMTADSSSSEASSSSLSLPFHYNNLPSSPSTNPQDQLEVMLSQIPEADDANHHNHTTFAPLLSEVEGEFDYPELRYTGLSCSGSSYVDSSWPAADDDVCGSFWNESSSSSESDASNYTYTYSYTNTTPVQEEGLLYNYDPLLVDYFDYEADLFC